MPASRPDEFDPNWEDDHYESLLDEFDRAWSESVPPSLEDYVRDAPVQWRASMLRELVAIDLEQRWKRRTAAKAGPQHSSSRSEPPLRLEDYQRRFPELHIDFFLVAEEWRVRSRWDPNVRIEEYSARFPQFADRLRELTAAQQPTSPATQSHSTRPDPAQPQPAEPPKPARNEKLSNEKASNNAKPSAEDVGLGKTRLPVQGGPDRIGRYQVRTRLGRGAMGEVYRAYDPQLDRDVAIKVPSAQVIGGRSQLAMLLREARLAATLRHPTVVSIYDVLSEDGKCYIVMEHVEGENLKTLLKRGLSLEAGVELLAELADALHEAHKLGLVHRDVKPANILVDRGGQPRLLDFGLAIRSTDHLPRAGELAGTPLYMSPEQSRGDAHRLDGRSDLWSLGVILYELLTGERPFLGSHWDELREEILHSEPKPPRQIVDTTSPVLERICLRCLSKELTGRYTTGKDLANALRRYSRGLGESIPRADESISASPGLPTPVEEASQLPHEEDTFVGRTRELQLLLPVLQDDETSLLTLTGPGGIGKTRLAVRLASAALEHFAGHCYFIDVSSNSTADEVATAVLHGLQIPLPKGGNVEQLVADVLRCRPKSLVVLDNFEQAVQCASQTVGIWRQRAPQLTFLLTSRERLSLTGEHAFELEALPVGAEPDGEGDGEATESDGVQLFLIRAREREPSFTPSEAEMELIREICRCLDGIPLAIELAAVRVSILKPSQIQARLTRKFQLLSSPNRNLPSRQRTLSGAIDWSFELLDDAERETMMQLSIIPRGFTISAAEEIVELPESPTQPLLVDVLQSLREKCLLRTADQGDELRFDMYLTIREYAANLRTRHYSEQAQDQLARRMAHFFVEHGEAWRARMGTPAAAQSIRQLSRDLDNLLAAHDWALGAGERELAARLVIAASPALAVRVPVESRIRCYRSCIDGASPADQVQLRLALAEAVAANGQLERAAEIAQEVRRQAEELKEGGTIAAALFLCADLLHMQGNNQAARRLFQQCEQFCQKINDPRRRAMTLDRLGLLAWQLGDFEEALQLYARAAEITQTTGDVVAGGSIARHRGHLLMQRGENEAALKCFLQAEQVAREVGDRTSLHRAITSRGAVEAERGNLQAALKSYEKAERIARDLGEQRAIAVNLGNRGLALADGGQYDQALECYAAAEQLNRAIGVRSGIALNCGNRGAALTALGRYEEALRALEVAETMHESLGNQAQIAINCRDRAEALAQLGRISEARELLHDSIGMMDSLGMQKTAEFFCAKATAAVVESTAGDTEGAAQLAMEAIATARQAAIHENHPRQQVRQLQQAVVALAEHAADEEAPDG